VESRYPEIKSLRTKLQYVLIILAIAVLGISVWFDSYLETEPLRTGSSIPLENGWTLTGENGVLAENIQLPYVISGTTDEKTFTVSRMLPDKLPNSNAVFSVDTSMTSLEILLDGESTYSFSGSGTPWKKPILGGGFTHFVRLPDWAPGHELSMVMTYSSDNSFAGRIKVPYIGTKADLMLAQLKEWPSLIFGFIFIFVGIVCALVSLGLRGGKARNSLWYFGWLESALGAWVFTQNCSKLFIIRNPVLPMNFSIAALFLLPYLLIQYVRASYRVVDRKTNAFFSVSLLFIGAYIIGGIFQYSGLFEYTDMLLISGLALAVYIISLFTVLAVDYFKGNKELISFLTAVGVLFATVLAEEILLILNISVENAVFLHLGMSLCGAILLTHSARVISQGQRTRFREQILLELAYTDSLTGAGNRAAYEERIESLSRESDKIAVTGVLLCDINDLKPINDTYGHAEGDRILKDFAVYLVENMPAGSEIYRIGGDEFVAFIPNVTPEQLDMIADQISCRRFKNELCSYTVAAGTARCVSQKKTILTEVISDADAAMYARKAAMKEQPSLNLSVSS